MEQISIGQKVLANIKRRKEEYRESDAWLNDGKNQEFDDALLLSDQQKENARRIFLSCSIADRKENRVSFDTLMANLLKYRETRPIIVSLSPNEWKHTRYRRRAGISTIDIIKVLHEKGFLKMKKGYRMEQEARKTRIWATEKLLECCPEFSTSVIYNPVELVELRDEKGNLKEYKDTAKTHKIRAILKQANKVNGNAEIYYKKDKLAPHLHAVFKEKFTMYGRLHTKGYRHYQGFSEDERARMTINGNTVVELDFSGMHPHLIYAKEGIQFSDDPYSMVDNRPEARPFLKNILLFMLNAENETKAEQAGNYWLFNNHKDRETLKKIGITRARPIINAFKIQHQRIAHHFCNGKKTGMRIMNLDGQIALDIIQHFTKKDIPILAIHDSFIVQAQYKDELEQVMQKVYRKHTGGFSCPIK